ncbi:MAG TPA: hypothetical protein VMR92_13395 [Gemmatimonadales bacterium]|nr:hypothetical protein [Gemmatimonadales bacterium]
MRAVLQSACAVLLVAFVSCGKDSVAPPEPGPPSDIHGTWIFSELLFGAQIACADDGSIDFSQSDADLHGTVTQQGTCNTVAGAVGNSRNGPLTGSVGRATIRFSFGGCSYHGYLTHLPVDSAYGTVECRTHLGISTYNTSGQWGANLEVAPPNVHGAVILPPGDSVVVTGEKIRIAIEASDPRGLRAIGYGLTPPASVVASILVSDTSVADTIELTVPVSWEGTSYLQVSARNAYGKGRSELVGHVSVFDAVRHPSQTTALGVRAADAAYDPARNVMYFTEPESARVAVLSLGTFTFGAPIPLPMVKRGLNLQSVDVVPGGDSAIVALPDTSQLAVLNRVGNSVTTSRVTGATGIDLLRVTANRKVFTIGQVDSGGVIFFAVIERDLVTGRDSIRRDLGHVTATATLWGSPDHSKMLVLTPGAPSCAYLYNAATDTFSSCSAFGFSASASATATTTGDRWLVGDKLVDQSLNVLATLVGTWPAGISPDGSVAYVGTSLGYDKIALPSGALLERVRVAGLPAAPVRITVFPEGTRLFLWNDWLQALDFGTYQATVVNLTH